jgi:hypothetical protein
MPRTSGQKVPGNEIPELCPHCSLLARCVVVLRAVRNGVRGQQMGSALELQSPGEHLMKVSHRRGHGRQPLVHGPSRFFADVRWARSTPRDESLDCGLRGGTILACVRGKRGATLCSGGLRAGSKAVKALPCTENADKENSRNGRPQHQEGDPRGGTGPGHGEHGRRKHSGNTEGQAVRRGR